MTRQLRPRKPRPSYASMAGYDLDEEANETGAQAEAGPASGMDRDEGSSGSEFSPENDKDAAEQMQQDAEDDEEPMQDEDYNEKSDIEDNEMPMNLVSDTDMTSAKAIQRASTSKGKGKAAPKKANTHPSLGTGLARTRRQMYTLPTPSVHHRHRAVPLYRREGRVERLKQPAELFKAPSIMMTNGVDQQRVMERLNKAWGYNAGPGPLWEMVEDRSWFKESMTIGRGGDAEAERRPVVHRDVRVKNGWQILNKEDAAPYLPTDTATTEEGNLKPPPPLTCYFGPFNAQTRIQLEMLSAQALSEFIPESSVHVFNPGAPAWGLDWCPIHQNDRASHNFKQYLAVAPFPSSSHSPDIGVKALRPSYSCIQIWSLSTSSPPETDSNVNGGEGERNPGKMECEMVVCHDSGPAHDLKWCPLPSHDPYSDRSRPRKLGLLAGTFEDGSLSIYVVPLPEDVRSEASDSSSLVYVKLSKPSIRIELEETSCWSLDWANSETIAIGTANGVIAVFHVGPALREAASPDAATVTDFLPTHYLTIHQSAIRALAWIKAPPSSASGRPLLEEDPTVIASGGYDGMECMTDIREGHGNVMNRTRDVITTMSYSPYGGGPVTIDHENIVKAYSASPSMLGRGHTLLEPQGPVWSISSSEWHPQLSVGSADGSCLTTNLLRSTRRTGAVPFFVHRIFQMDYQRKTGEYRMLDRFLPHETQDRPATTKAKANSKSSKNDSSKAPTLGTGAWPQEVAVHKVTWNNGNGLGACGLLASATSSGLCRVDNLWGRWMKDKVPYGGIQQIRREGMEDDMDVDSEDSGSD
ncbi:Transcription factor tau subunit sfc6 [Leucoagaricus sp. SymC.cos]|nr:Transcription factor tau subunit sfc6 [Leucoagaricus sp. SymC.cos]